MQDIIYNKSYSHVYYKHSHKLISFIHTNTRPCIYNKLKKFYTIYKNLYIYICNIQQITVFLYILTLRWKPRSTVLTVKRVHTLPISMKWIVCILLIIIVTIRVKEINVKHVFLPCGMQRYITKHLLWKLILKMLSEYEEISEIKEINFSIFLS